MARKPVIAPTTPEFRAAAHAALDALLDKARGSDVVLISVDGPGGQEAISIPSALTVKLGMISALHETAFPALYE